MSILNEQLTQRISGLDKFNYINNNKIELNNLLIILEQILSTYWNTYITFILEGKITDARSLFLIIYSNSLYFHNLYVCMLYC